MYSYSRVTYLSPQYECKCWCLLQCACMFKTLVEFHTSVPSTYVSVGEAPDEKKWNRKIKMVIFQFLTIGCVCPQLSEVCHVVSVCLMVSLSFVHINQHVYLVLYKHCRRHICAFLCLGKTASDPQIIPSPRTTKDEGCLESDSSRVQLSHCSNV